MKVYGCPEHLAHIANFENCFVDGEYNSNRARELEKEFYVEAKKYLVDLGYTGSATGKTVKFGVGDGCAIYMVFAAENNTKMGLLHCPFGDSYHADPILLRGLNKADVMKMLNRKSFSEIYNEIHGG